jgi:hypothetical protein
MKQDAARDDDAPAPWEAKGQSINFYFHSKSPQKNQYKHCDEQIIAF